MKFKMRVHNLQKALVTGTLAEERPQLAMLLGWMLSFFLGFTLAAVPVGGRGGPFGIAITAVIGTTLGGLFSTIGASLSYLAFLGIDLGVRYVATVFLTFTASYVFRDLGICRRRWFMPAISALFTLLTGMLSSFISLEGSRLLAPVLLQSVLTFGSAYFFREALQTPDHSTETSELRHTISLLLLGACLLMALSGAVIVGYISVGRILAMVIAAVIGYKCGAVTGASAGLVLGFAMDAAVLDAPLYGMTYAAAALIGGVFSKHGRFLYILTYLVAVGLCFICISFNGYRLSMLFETVISAGIFVLLPNRLMSIIGSVLRPTQFDSGESGLRKYAARRVERIGDAFAELYATVDTTLAEHDNRDDATKVFDRASEVVCSKCKNKNLCWNANYIDTLSAFNDSTEAIRGRGQLLVGDLPTHFAEACLHPDELVSAVNGELRGQMYRRQFRARIAENRTAAYSQYLHISEILANVSDELRNAFGPDPLAKRRLLRYLNSVDIEADVSVFRDRSGRLHMILESTRLKQLLREPTYLDKLSAAIGVRLCRPVGSDGDAEGRITLLEAEPYSVTVGIASMKKKGESVSGDRGTYFKTEQGILCILLSDGMGSGNDAAKESVAAVRILERFLRSGVDPAVAMQMLNSMMLLKNAEDWGFATVDLMCIDLFTGEAAFYKYGAAPSYVRSGKSVRRVKSETLAAGLIAGDGTAPDIVRLRLKPGSVALIASDGVLTETKDDWVQTMLADYAGADTKALARSVLQEALKKYGCGDDMTVLAVQMDNRS